MLVVDFAVQDKHAFKKIYENQIVTCFPLKYYSDTSGYDPKLNLVSDRTMARVELEFFLKLSLLTCLQVHYFQS